MDLLILGAVVVNVLATCGVWFQLSFRMSRLETAFYETHGGPSGHCSGSNVENDQFSLWAFRDSQWKLEAACSAPGLVVGAPPARDGRFEGEIVRTLGVSASEQTSA